MNKSVVAAHFSLHDEQMAQLEEYVSMIIKWNKISNLTAIRDEETIWTHHILDSLLVHPHIMEKRMIDVGTGAGLPGIPLAIMDPSRHVTLLDSQQKKTRFLQQVKLSLQLGNIEVVHSRVEEHSVHYDAVISRAMTQIPLLNTLCAHLVPEGKIYALKSLKAHEECETFDKAIKLLELTTSTDLEAVLGKRVLVSWAV